LDEGFYAGVALAKSGESRQNHDGVCRQVVRLEIIVVQEVSEEVTNRESKSSLKV
jgi:hypothetical protein